jgi:LmbE family N-acetylglucosaminyl deacetylase
MATPVTVAIRRWRPRLVLGPCPEDLHPDHVAAAALVRNAYYLATIGKAEGGGLPPHRPDALVHYFGHLEPTPSFVVDVSDVWERKRELIRCFTSQMGLDGAGGQTTNLTSPDFQQRYEARFAYWGARIGSRWGEPFLTHRMIPLDDPVDALRKRGWAVL